METENLQAGQCPKCSGSNLDYSCSESAGEQIKYPFTCKDCSFEGIEWCSVTFVSMTTEDGEEVTQRPAPKQINS